MFGGVRAPVPTDGPFDFARAYIDNNPIPLIPVYTGRRAWPGPRPLPPFRLLHLLVASKNQGLPRKG